jgi:hypothetical protein
VFGVVLVKKKRLEIWGFYLFIYIRRRKRRRSVGKLRGWKVVGMD